MRNARFRINEHFVIERDDFGIKAEVIYRPPLLAEYGNIRVELRKERNLKYFKEREFQKVVEFVVENRERFIKIYHHLKGEL